MEFVKVTGTSFVRDVNSMGLSNVDQNEKNEYYSRVRMLQNQKAGLNKVNEDISALRNEMSEIKNLLAKLIHKE